jgi:hypothetical protein
MGICLWVAARLCRRAFGIDLTARIGAASAAGHDDLDPDGLRRGFGTRSITGARGRGG